jgi:hypothetical protein
LLENITFASGDGREDAFGSQGLRGYVAAHHNISRTANPTQLLRYGCCDPAYSEPGLR